MHKPQPLKLAVLISGSGKTLVNLIEQIRSGHLNCKIEIVIASRHGIKGIDHANREGLPFKVINPKLYDGVEAFRRDVFAVADQHGVELVCLAGWLCLLKIPGTWTNRVMNIHPSLLPRFGGKGMYGMHVHQAVLDEGCTISGCTVHLVDDVYDHGTILLQRSCPVLPNDTATSLATRVFEEEKIAYPQAIRDFQNKLIASTRVDSRPILANDQVMLQPPSLTLTDIRTDYRKGHLHESDLCPDPVDQFTRWFDDAQKANIAEPTAMTLATADSTGMPSARIVLLKEYDPRGFVFYTSRTSKKGTELLANPRASLVFFWQELERQVRIEGQVEEVSREQSEKYFHSRPIASQIGAWVSHQSQVIYSRDALTEKEVALTKEYAGRQIPLPDFWGGFRVIPNVIEFWQGRSSRLHDRLRYQRVDTGWKIERLAP